MEGSHRPPQAEKIIIRVCHALSRSGRDCCALNGFLVWSPRDGRTLLGFSCGLRSDGYFVEFAGQPLGLERLKSIFQVHQNLRFKDI